VRGEWLSLEADTGCSNGGHERLSKRTMARLQEQVGGREGIGRQNGPDKILLG
jgi:hypothetical protein